MTTPEPDAPASDDAAVAPVDSAPVETAPAAPETADAAPAPAPRARRRAPKRDELLAAAVEEARAGLDGLAADDQVGEHLGVTVEDDRLVTHRFAADLPGYAGWVWYSTVARAPRAKRVTVCEAGLEAGEGAVVAPPWVPYEERVSAEERARLQAVAEGRVPDGATAAEDGPDDDRTDEAPAED